jgi:aminomethyltransferase
MRRTPLFEACRSAGGRMVPFAGWEMAVQFAGVLAEHQAVRQHSGLFDISHMGVLRLWGPGVKNKLQGLVPSDLDRIGPGESQYTVLLNNEGGIRDDLIVYDQGLQQGNEQLLLVINAACAEADSTWIRQQLEPQGIQIADPKGDGVLLALQGPEAVGQLERLCGEGLAGLPRFGHRQLTIAGEPVFAARTGYTGEDGFELLLAQAPGIKLWQQLLAAGVTPCGLGARDSLRLEAALPLYGQDLDASTSPLEAGLGWLVHLEMPLDFIGREALEQQTATGLGRRLVGLELQGRNIARHGYPLWHNGEPVGEISSGSWAPSLGRAIALAYLPSPLSKPGTNLEVEIRGRREAVQVVKRPFYRRS